jgi:hypothetical protein
MAEEREQAAFGDQYRQGFRAGVATIVRGLLLVEADELDAGALIGALSRYEEQLEVWIEAGQGGGAGAPAPPAWQPTAGEIGVEEAPE